MTPSENTFSRISVDAACGPNVEADMHARLSDPDFVEDKLIIDYLAGELSPADRERVEERLRTDAEFCARAEPLTSLWKLRLPGESPAEPDLGDHTGAADAWEKLKARIKLEERGKHTLTLAEKYAKRRRQMRFVLVNTAGMAAGMIALALTLWLRPHLIPYPTLSVDVIAPLYEQRSAKLPDETQVILTPGSGINYPRVFSSSFERTLHVSGEATFTVAPGQLPLVVRGLGVQVKASEGRFTIHSYNGEPVAYVQVDEGSVEVRAQTLYGTGQVIRLHAGEGAKIGPGLNVDRINVTQPQAVRIR